MDAFSSYSLAGSGPMYVKKGWSSSSAHGGAGGSGTRISSIYSGSRLGSGSVVGGIRREGGYHVQTSITAGTGGFAMGNDKSTMQHLNDRLATYLETVRNLETVNEKLEVKIRETLQKSGPTGKDYSHYEATLVALRKQILEAVIANARVASQLDNASLAADDFQAKLGYEIEMCQIVDADVSKLRKVLDDTNIIRMHLESDIECLKGELISLKKNHEAEVMELRAVISASSVQVDVDAPKGQDLAQIMEEMRAKYEKMALKNQQELKAWHESKITEVQIQVTENTTALKEASSTVSESSRRMQSLQIELQSEMSLKASLEGTLCDVEMRYTMLLEKYQGNILCLQAELTQLRSNIQGQGQEYQALFNIKIKLEAEIQTYRRLLEGGDFRLEEALEESVLKSVKQTNTKTIIQTLVDGKVVASETSEVKSTQP